jgi:hypothetical protein
LLQRPLAFHLLAVMDLSQVTSPLLACVLIKGGGVS